MNDTTKQTGRRKLRSALGAAAAQLTSSTSKSSTDEGAASSGFLSGGYAALDAMGGKINTVVEREIDPRRCKIWVGNKRLYERLDETFLSELIASIRTHGQRDAVIVRSVEGDPDHGFEIVDGASRHWAISYLKLPFIRAEVRDDLSDEDCFLLAHDSQVRNDLSPYEEAAEIAFALDTIYGGNQTMMADRSNLSQGKISKAMALWKLDEAVIGAFTDPRALTFEQAAKLRSAMNDRQRRQDVLKAAKRLGREEGKSAAEVFGELMGNKPAKKAPAPAAVDVSARGTGKRMLSAKRDAKNKLGITLFPESGASKKEILQALEKLLSEHNGEGKYY